MPICHNKKFENEFLNKMNSEGHYCVRVAGSGSGVSAVCDCVLFKDGRVYLVEVKATREKKFYNRKHIREQLELMKDKARQLNVSALLAIKYKYKGWEMIEL